jgi:hypothetical protein
MQDSYRDLQVLQVRLQEALQYSHEGVEGNRNPEEAASEIAAAPLSTEGARCGPRSVHTPSAAAKLRDYMSEHAFSQRGFSESIGRKVSTRTISKFLKTAVASPLVLDEIAAAMNISKEDLLR